MNDSIILQGSNSSEGCSYYPHLSMLVPIHCSYAKHHNFDYRVEFGDISNITKEKNGGYTKIDMILDVIDKYKYVVWIDADAMITDATVDLRNASRGKISAVKFSNPQYNGRDHVNVGVMFIRSCPEVKEFLIDLRSRPIVLWNEQGMFNDMIYEEKYKDIFNETDATYNCSLYNYKMDNPVIKAWHSNHTPLEKLVFMVYEAKQRGLLING